MPIKIFCCYAHEDEEFLNKLKTHLSLLEAVCKGRLDPLLRGL
jgi:hypothetical protein